MTTISWNTYVLAGDRFASLEDDSIGIRGIAIGDCIETKIFTPPSPIRFENSQIIAFAGAGDMHFILALKNKLFSSDISKLAFADYSSDEASKTGKECDLFILTKEICWMVSVRSGQTAFKDVTKSKEAIGTGRNYAFMMLRRGYGSIASVLLASCNDNKTNDKITLVKWKSERNLRKATALEYCLGWCQVMIFKTIWQMKSKVLNIFSSEK